jgi:hypothetical protein
VSGLHNHNGHCPWGLVNHLGVVDHCWMAMGPFSILSLKTWPGLRDGPSLPPRAQIYWLMAQESPGV